MTYTRKTHVVRCYPDGDKAYPDYEESNYYVDVEVLDEITFKTTNGKEVVLKITTDKCSPLIKDTTGHGNAKNPSSPTRTSHMKTVLSAADAPNGCAFDIEIIDRATFKDSNGKEWVLSMPADKASDTTRKTHKEKIQKPDGGSGGYGGSGQSYGHCVIKRVDRIGFKTNNGKEIALNIKSCDNPGPDDHSDGSRASTKMSPDKYDPKDNSQIPPRNKDPHKYVWFEQKTTTTPAYQVKSPWEYFVYATNAFAVDGYHSAREYDIAKIDPNLASYAEGEAEIALLIKIAGGPMNNLYDFKIGHNVIYRDVPGSTTTNFATPCLGDSPIIEMGPLWWIRKVNEGASKDVSAPAP